MYPITRSGVHLMVREIVQEDTDGIFAAYGDEKVTEHLSFTPRTRQQVQEIVSRSMLSATESPRTEYALAVVERDGGETIGLARLAIDPHQQQAATMGFALRATKWGQGYGRETVNLIHAVAFKDLDLHRVWAARSPLNRASHRTLISAGMAEEGKIRGHVLVRGVWRDSITYGILRDEWSLAK